MQDEATHRYYEENAQSVFDRTLQVQPGEENFAPFLELIQPGGHILDAGCGSGRDSRYFLSKGYTVTAIDASAALCLLAECYLNHPVLNLSFDALDFDACFDGIWASLSLVHVPREGFPPVLARFARAIKPGGVLYATFFYGRGELRRGGLLFNDFDEEAFSTVLTASTGLTASPALELIRQWQTPELPPARPGKILFHVLLQRLST